MSTVLQELIDLLKINYVFVTMDIMILEILFFNANLVIILVKLVHQIVVVFHVTSPKTEFNLQVLRIASVIINFMMMDSSPPVNLAIVHVSTVFKDRFVLYVQHLIIGIYFPTNHVVVSMDSMRKQETLYVSLVITLAEHVLELPLIVLPVTQQNKELFRLVL